MKLIECLTWVLVRPQPFIINPHFISNDNYNVSFKCFIETQVRSIANHVRPDRQSESLLIAMYVHARAGTKLQCTCTFEALSVKANECSCLFQSPI